MFHVFGVRMCTWRRSQFLSGFTTLICGQSSLFLNNMWLTKCCSGLFSKLQELVPQEEIDLLASHETWKPHEEVDHTSQAVSCFLFMWTQLSVGRVGQILLRDFKSKKCFRSSVWGQWGGGIKSWMTSPSLSFLHFSVRPLPLCGLLIANFSTIKFCGETFFRKCYSVTMLFDCFKICILIFRIVRVWKVLTLLVSVLLFMIYLSWFWQALNHTCNVL